MSRSWAHFVSAAAKDNEAFRPLVFTEIDGQRLPTWNLTLLQGSLASFAYDRTGIDALARWLGPNESNPGLSYADTTANGFGRATFDSDMLAVELVTMDDLRQPFEQPPAVKAIARFKVSRWQAGEAPALEGPTFSGEPPFPFSLDAV